MTVAARLILLSVRALGMLPVAARSALGMVLGGAFGLIPTKERRFARLQIERFLGSAPTPLAFMRLYSSFGQSLFESLNLTPLLGSSHVQLEAEAEVSRLLAAKKGIVALTAHLGNWDLLGAYMVRRAVPLSTIGREARNPALQSALESIREEYGIKTHWRGGAAGIKDILSDLENGRVVSALIDQDTSVTSILTPFFGHPVRTPSTLVELGKSRSALFVTAFIMREGLGRYRIFVEEIDSSLSTEQILTIYHQRLESFIRKYPWQWVWFHKRWRARPDGSRMSSSEYLLYLEGGERA